MCVSGRQRSFRVGADVGSMHRRELGLPVASASMRPTARRTCNSNANFPTRKLESEFDRSKNEFKIFRSLVFNPIGGIPVPLRPAAAPADRKESHLAFSRRHYDLSGKVLSISTAYFFSLDPSPCRSLKFVRLASEQTLISKLIL